MGGFPSWLVLLIAVLVVLAILWLIGVRFGVEDSDAARAFLGV